MPLSKEEEKDGGCIWGLSFFLYSPLSVSESTSLFCSQLASIRCLNAVQCGLSSNRNADDTGPAAVLPPSLSPGLLLCTEGNKDTRRISVVCLTKWLPESERAMPMGTTTTLLRSTRRCRGPPPACASLRSALSQGALWMCDRLCVGEVVLMLKKQRTQQDNPWLKQCCSNFSPLYKGTYVQTVKYNSITYSRWASFH